MLGLVLSGNISGDLQMRAGAYWLLGGGGNSFSVWLTVFQLRSVILS